MTSIGPDRGWPTPPAIPGTPVAGSGGISIVPFQQRQAQQQRTAAARARVYEHQAFIAVSGTGMTTQDVNFPVRFIELPAFSFGWSLEDGQQLQPGNYPRVDVGVARWNYEDHPMQVRYFIGATLAITATGATDQRLIVHYQVVAKTVGTLGGAADQSADGAV